MIINLQHKFKPHNTSPGFEDGQEACVHKGLTEYAEYLEVPCFVLQLWRGNGEESYVEGYVIVDKNTKKILFFDHRHDVIEYVIETYAEQIQTQKDEETTSSTQ